MDLGADAGSAYHRFWLQARTLGSISRSFDALAVDTTAAYYTALSRPAGETWTALVMRTASLVRSARTLDGIVVLDEREREALAFFEAIVRENADLLAACEEKSREDVREHHRARTLLDQTA